MREERRVYKVLVRKPKGKRPLGALRHRWEDGIGMDLGGIGWVLGVSILCLSMCRIHSAFQINSRNTTYTF
jgi:hypothetical protein